MNYINPCECPHAKVSLDENGYNKWSCNHPDAGIGRPLGRWLRYGEPRPAFCPLSQEHNIRGAGMKMIDSFELINPPKTSIVPQCFRSAWWELMNVIWCIKKGFPLKLILCEVSCKDIPASTRFLHPIGITILPETIIGENCIIGQNVTIGTRKIWEPGMMEESPPCIGNNVTIFAGVTILGDVTVGNNATIGADAVVLDNIPANAVYVCKIIPSIVGVKK